MAAKLRLEIDDASRFRHWQRTKQNRIRQAEHDRIRANSEGDRQDGDYRERAVMA